MLSGDASKDFQWLRWLRAHQAVGSSDAATYGTKSGHSGTVENGRRSGAKGERAERSQQGCSDDEEQGQHGAGDVSSSTVGTFSSLAIQMRMIIPYRRGGKSPFV